jgi:hypothetical protein
VPSVSAKKLASSPTEEFLDHHFGAGRAEPAGEDLAQRRFGLGFPSGR